MNNSTVLALKYRPQNFDELVGQESVSKTLKHSLESQSLANAYLFSGLRGSGKTSSARIFAKTLLCENTPTSKPCDKCESCNMANSSSHMDIIEMDAASNRKIDDIRALIEQTKYQPSSSKFKIFIIDEVHMLTKEAFNALLKTLEEPPEYIKFILATTDPLKLPSTILSRTQHFVFKRVEKRLIENHLKKILQIEDVEYDLKSIEVISRSGDGSLRDTLTLLQQAIVYCENNVNIDDVTEMLGLIDPQTLDNIFILVKEKKREALLKAIEDLQAYDSELIIDEFINLLKQKMFDNELDAQSLTRIFKALNEGKNLLFTGADSGFVLYLTFLNMITENDVITETKIVKNITIEKEIPIVKNKKLSDTEFFDFTVIKNILSTNPAGKISDEVLEKALRKNVKLLEFNGIEISVQICFNDEYEKILKARFVSIRTSIVQAFNNQYQNKTKFKYIECKKDIEIAEIKEKVQPIKQAENNQTKFLSDIKDIFKIPDKNIEINKKPDNSLMEFNNEKVDFIFDVETNGLSKDNSVLSISFIIAIKDKILYEENRYYFSKEPMNQEAIKIHGLTEAKINNLRVGINYPKYFKEDTQWLINTIRENNVTNFVAHNIKFDMKYMPTQFKNDKFDNFCTMMENKKFVNIIQANGKLKNPKLSEACEKHRIDFDEKEAHDSRYDTLKAFELYKKTI